MKTRRFLTILLVILLLPTITVMAKGKPGDGGETTPVNNLSFPVIAADEFTIAPVTGSLTVPYTGPYTDLSAEELEIALGDTWYAQKVDGNTWQAAYVNDTGEFPVAVYGVDWGDNVESVYPVVGRPFRLEVVLFVQLTEPMNAYTMTVLANPSSLDEIQGTNGVIYASDFATVVSPRPKLVIQYIEGYDPATLTWDGAQWVAPTATPTVVNVGFGSELNVAGRYIYGASSGGWKPAAAGTYRITFYLPDSNISLADAIVGNYADWIGGETLSETEGAATPVIDSANNISYVDVLVKPKGGRK